MGIKEHRTFSLELNEIWESLNREKGSPVFSKFFIQQKWTEIFGFEEKICILNHSNKLIMPLIIDENRTGMFIGGQDLFDVHDLVYADIIDQKKMDDLISYSFEKLNIKELHLFSVQENSHFSYCLEKSLKKLNLRYQKQFEDVSPYIPLPDNWSSYLMTLSKKDRHEIRRKARKINSSEKFKQIDCQLHEFDKQVSIFFKLMEYNAHKKKFLSKQRKEFMHSIINEAIKNDYGTLRILFYENQAVSASFYFHDDEKISAYNSGFDPDFSNFSVGFVNHILSIKKSIGAFKEMDFLRGDESYKYKLGCKNRNLITIKIRKERF